MNEGQNVLFRARRIVTQRLESLLRAGVQQIGKVRNEVPLPPGEGGPGTDRAPRAAWSALVGGPGEGLQVAAAAADLAAPSIKPSAMPRSKPTAALAPSMLSLISQSYPAELPTAAAACQDLLNEQAGQVRSCRRCRDLCETRTQTVYGVGNARPRVVFFGEAPGADEDRQGEPFVGRAGQLLTKIIEACGWQRSDVYIMNVLKCRPPENRNPLPNEVENCRPFFDRQLEILRPEYIVCVGSISSQALLETTDSVGKLRGRFYRYRDSKVLVTYHPSYLLRNPAAKKYVWEDMQLLLKDMGLPIPRRGAS